jgi:pimeloyl-ACP methyl ester carboxylesterase
LSGVHLQPLAAALAFSAWLLSATGAQAAPVSVAAPQPHRSPAPAWIEVNGVSLRYQLGGAPGNSVVLLHEIGMSLESWDEIMPFIDAGHRVLRYDLRGFGESEKIRGAVSLDEEVADLRSLLDALGLPGPVTLVGGALGASIALHFAATYPERVRSLVLVSPIFNVARSAVPAAPAVPAVPAAPAAPAAPMRSAPAMDPATAIERNGIRAYLDAKQLEALYPSVLRTDPLRWRRFLGIELAGDPDSRAATLRMVAHAGDAGGELAGLRCPTLFVATALFPLRTPASIQALADVVPRSQVAVLATGHLAALESPQLLGPVLQQFLRQAGTRAGD